MTSGRRMRRRHAAHVRHFFLKRPPMPEKNAEGSIDRLTSTTPPGRFSLPVLLSSVHVIGTVTAAMVGIESVASADRLGYAYVRHFPERFASNPIASLLTK